MVWFILISCSLSTWSLVTLVTLATLVILVTLSAWALVTRAL